MQKLQHVVPALVLFWEGVQRIWDYAGESSRWLGTAEAFASALVLGSIARALGRLKWGAGDAPRRRHVDVHAVDWLELFMAAMLFIEVLTHFQETGRWRRPTLLLAVTTLVVGLCHGRLIAWATKRGALRITDEGVSAGERFFKRFVARWDQIARIDVDQSSAAVVTHDGRTKRFDLTDLRHGGDVARALTRARARLAASRQPAPGEMDH